ncbi:MAG: YitT family protein [[Lactobacillus] timonensis]|jgi:uncharacterized membrane-anchored protein YitT (DUF2179 family)|uniref:YitT family protein n=1 Tax=[Lactobacillus] timonensis TaxID=1970790 RepID=UPI000C83B0FA|nr:YitT family protein [[Lactobacillus] timonensis]MCI1925528.1 YitT family protein [[Lactobacillus] timonensis]MCI1956886.1 YitT family protein [[Lactobacillus] timonensis]MCI1969876.1 YitT family protein [[Lactobacillus] timonensis]MCI2006077.1 YitT family protein [[Lactobacillus] timonensis]
MEEIQRIVERHRYIGRFGTAIVYAVLVATAVNLFWTPGRIYSSGITGLAQLISTLTMHAPVHLGTGIMLFVINSPLFIIAWFKISHRFTIFTVMAVGFSSIMIHVFHPVAITNDPLICSIFGAVLNGCGTGLCLRYGISTGGLDIIGILMQRKTSMKIGTINVIFNIFIVMAAGFVFGWPNALDTTIGLVINAKMIDLIYTRQQLRQVMIVTNKPDEVANEIQRNLRRGITVIRNAEGAYRHRHEDVLFTVVTVYELYSVRESIFRADPHAFVSMTEATAVVGNFYEPKR